MSKTRAILDEHDEWDGCDVTERFLSLCKLVGYTAVSVGVSTPSVPYSEQHPFPARGSVFAFPDSGREEKRLDGWPAVWAIVDRMGIGCGCGNRHQHQVKPGALTDGVYILNDAGEWQVAS